MKRIIFTLVSVFAASMAVCAAGAKQEAVAAEKTVTAGELKALDNFSAEEKAEVKTAAEEKISDVLDKKAAAKVKKPSLKHMKLSKKLFEQSALELKKGETARATVTAGEAQVEAAKEAIGNSITAREEKDSLIQAKKDRVNEDLKDVKKEILERKEVNKEIKARETEVPDESAAEDSKDKAGIK